VADVPLVHTATLLPYARGKTAADPDVGRQTDQLLSNIEQALDLGGSSLARIAKLNLSVREPEMVAPVEAALARRFSGKPMPAVTLVVGLQPGSGVLVSGDAVGTAPDRKNGVGARPVRLRSNALPARAHESHAAILPPGPKVYLSARRPRVPRRSAGVRHSSC
jgi:enamine deaminase RidA (YjgF/YER057c/UK114 family)